MDAGTSAQRSLKWALPSADIDDMRRAQPGSIHKHAPEHARLFPQTVDQAFVAIECGRRDGDVLMVIQPLINEQ